MAGVGMNQNIVLQKIALLKEHLLTPANRQHLTSAAFANATTAEQQATLDAFANQVAMAAAPAPAPAPALSAAQRHQAAVDLAQATATASRQSVGIPQCQMLLFSSFHVY